MPFWKIAWRNIEQRALASSLTALSMALGVAVMIAVIVIHSVAVRQFEQDAQGYNLIVGGKGGALQLVLSTVYYLGQPLYPIPYSYYEKFIGDGEFAMWTEVAVPECLGDSYVAPNGEVFRIVATTPDLFDKIHYGNNPDGTPKVYEFQPGGRNLKNALPLAEEEFETAAFEAVIGSVAAARSGLHVGDKINPTHGLGAEGHKHDAFTIVGILKPTGTANDRAVFINIEGFYLLEGHALSGDDEHADHAEEAEHEHDHEADDSDAHEHENHEPLPLDQREVTSILVLCKNAMGPTVLDTAINKGEGHVAQAVAPIREVTRLMDGIVGPIRLILLVLTVLIVIVAAISILVSIYNSMSERSHDIAVMRALGASRSAVMNIVLVESILLSLGGGLLGILLAHGMIGLASPYVEARTGVTLGWLQFEWQEIVLIPALVVLASLVGFLPAVSAYRTDVAKALAGSR
jgi:putative ABC transport system permease protein